MSSLQFPFGTFNVVPHTKVPRVPVFYNKHPAIDPPKAQPVEALHFPFGTFPVVAHIPQKRVAPIKHVKHPLPTVAPTVLNYPFGTF